MQRVLDFFRDSFNLLCFRQKIVPFHRFFVQNWFLRLFLIEPVFFVVVFAVALMHSLFTATSIDVIFQIKCLAFVAPHLSLHGK